jgi:hypothetical protein
MQSGDKIKKIEKGLKKSKSRNVMAKVLHQIRNWEYVSYFTQENLKSHMNGMKTLLKVLREALHLKILTISDTMTGWQKIY